MQALQPMAPLVQETLHQMPAPPSEARRPIFREYQEETMSFFVPTEVAKTLLTEVKRQKGKLVSAQEIDDATIAREKQRFVDQPNKLGPDGVHKLYNSGPYVTVDALVCYCSQEPDGKGGTKDVLNFYLLWADGKGIDRGWTMPGMRDRAYEQKDWTISIQDSNAYLVEKECGVKREDIAYQAVLGAFDDRTRDDRGIFFSIVSLVMLNKIPPITAGKAIAMPFNQLEELVNGTKAIERVLPESFEKGYMARNHDSLLRQVFKCAKLYHMMEKIRIAQGNFRELQRQDPRAERPSLPEVEPDRACPVCMELMVGARIICEEGHSICQVCLPEIQRQGNCHTCRDKPILAKPIRNRDLDALIQSLQPDDYRQRFEAINMGEAPKSWKDQDLFKGNLITYKVIYKA